MTYIFRIIKYHIQSTNNTLIVLDREIRNTWYMDYDLTRVYLTFIYDSNGTNQ